LAILDLLIQYWPLFLQGFETTLILAATGFLLGVAIGLPTSILETYASKIVRWIAVGYVELIRGTPMLVQLFIIYYALPQLGIRFDAMTAAILGLGINSGAYQAEYFRGAIQSVPSGQMDAAISIGMTRAQALLHVILAQSLRLVIPAWTNEAVYLVQYSSVVYLIAVVELTGIGAIIGSRTFQYVAVYSIIALIYLATTLLIVKSSHLIERRTSIPGLKTSQEPRL
jgi:His/Glu/Gln/Arg/opine family amino acid ABC transporter permease subunit